jgi:hypothetical protein
LRPCQHCHLLGHPQRHNQRRALRHHHSPRPAAAARPTLAMAPRPSSRSLQLPSFSHATTSTTTSTRGCRRARDDADMPRQGACATPPVARRYNGDRSGGVSALCGRSRASHRRGMRKMTRLPAGGRGSNFRYPNDRMTPLKAKRTPSPVPLDDGPPSLPRVVPRFCFFNLSRAHRTAASVGLDTRAHFKSSRK